MPMLYSCRTLKTGISGFIDIPYFPASDPSPSGEVKHSLHLSGPLCYRHMGM